MSHFILYVPHLILYTALGVTCIYSLNKYFDKLTWTVPCIVGYFNFKIAFHSIIQIYECFVEAFNQYQIVSGFEGDYARYMSTLYLEPLSRGLHFIFLFIITMLPTIICILFYIKLHKQSDKEKEMKKMKILDL